MVVGAVVSGFFEPFENDLYQTTKGVILNTNIPIYIIPILFAIAGLGIIVYDIFFRRKHKPEPKLDNEVVRRKRERDWRFFPSNYK